MQIKRLALRGFRSYKTMTAEFNSNRVFITGPNGSGKTNILEAIGFLSTTRSMKKAEDEELITFGNDMGYASADYLSNDGSHSIEVTLEHGKKTFKVDDVKKKTAMSVIGNLLTVTYDPTMVFLFKEDPMSRRKLLDETLSMIDSQYLYSLSRYKKYLKERNQALTLSYDPDIIDILTLEMIQSSYRVMVLRKRFIERLNTHVKEIFKRLDDSEKDISLKYKTNVYIASNYEDYLEEMKKIYKNHVSEEVTRKMTLIGIHRDDMLAEIDGIDLGTSGSQGQNRLVTLAIKLATAELVKEVTKDDPILLLDDVFSDLDRTHLARLVKEIDNYEGQVFVTSCIDNEEVLLWEHFITEDNQLRRG